MRFIVAVAFLLLSAAPAFCAGDVYFGKYFDPRIYGAPNGSNPHFVAGVYADHAVGTGDILSKIVPYIKLETLMDAQNRDNSFHPISIRYDIGLDVKIYDGWYVGGSRMCWHPVDHGGIVEQYWLVKAGYKW